MENQEHLQRVESLLKTMASAMDVIAQEHFDKEAEKKRKEYLLLIVFLFSAYLADLNADKFIRNLKTTNTKRLREFCRLGYIKARGMNEQVPKVWQDVASRFVNWFAKQFRSDLKNNAGTMDYKRRALMYGEEGYRIAYLNGVQAAMEEKGATHWQRVLHPESSVTGPCFLCVEDSKTIHPISEPFLSLHPNDVCTMNPVGIRFTGGASFELGIPGLTENEITRLLRELDIEPETIVRRPPIA